MIPLKKEHVLSLFDNLLCFCLLGLGVYFIYMGDVIPRFWLGRTNFAQYDEALTELPIIATYVTNVPVSFTIRKDFNLSLNGKILDLGINNIKSHIHLKVRLQHVMPELQLFINDVQTHFLQIRPLNFPPEVPHRLDLLYSFATTLNKSQIGIYLSSENTTFECFERNYDGEKITILAKMGQDLTLKLQPRKIIHLQKNKRCRERPYLEKLVQNIDSLVLGHNRKLCRPKNIFGVCPAVAKSEKIKQLPRC